MTPSAAVRGGAKQTRWTREAVIEKIREWVATYGEPPRAADWNPSSAKWAGQTWRIARYEAGDWPSLNAAKRPFGDKLSEAIKAAGFEPNRPGPVRRSNAKPELVMRLDMPAAARAALEGALADAKRATAKLDIRDRQLAAAREATARLRAELGRAPKVKPVTETKTKTVTKVKIERVRDERALARAKAAADRADEARRALATDLVEAKADAREARDKATKLASRLERAEATINTLREERRENRDELRRALDRVTALERLLDAEREREPEVKVEIREVEVESPEAARVREADASMARARRIEEDAELRVAKAEREVRELAALVTGEERRLTNAEMKELRTGGPSGPSVLAAAFKELALARRRGGRNDTKGALIKVASAAIRWRERL